MTTLDLGPATQQMGTLVAGVSDDQLTEPTPCPDYTLGDLLEHVGGFTIGFTMAAQKKTSAEGGPPPPGDASRLADDWRPRIERDLDGLAEAWRDPDAWTGMTAAGGIALPGEIAGVVALDELVVHGWDVARASGQPFDVDPTLLEAVHGFVQGFADPAMAETRAGLFGPIVDVPEGAPLLDRVIGLAGRDPYWTPG
jgi:uncharacterized protein (TIGR03086 family)